MGAGGAVCTARAIHGATPNLLSPLPLSLPFSAPDLQIEYTMMDPHVRANLILVAGSPNGTHACDIAAPDVYGVFKFVVDYTRPG